MTTIRVVDVRRMRRPEQRAGVVYVGRWHPAGWAAHPLANPFKPGQSATVSCLDRYREWLLARPTLEADIAALWEACGRGVKPLGCWCVDAECRPGEGAESVACHAQVLAHELLRRYASASGGEAVEVLRWV